MSNILIEKIKKEIENLSLENVSVEKVGKIISVMDGVIEIEGLDNAIASEMILIKNSSEKSLEEEIDSKSGDDKVALVLNIEEDSIKAVVLGSDEGILEGDTVIRTEKVLSIPVSDKILGRVVDTLGNPIDGKGEIEVDRMMDIERESYGVMDRASVNEPMQTGIKSIDAMIPIGRGQRELIIGDRGTGKTTIAIDTILNQKNESPEKRPICIYVATGQKDSKTMKIVSDLEEKGALEYTVVVSAGASNSAVMQYLSPFAGVSIAEYFMEKGKDVLIIYDDLTKQAMAYRQTSLLLRRPPGREAYPGDVFYLHSRLLERAAKLNEKLGGGSITALPIIETQEGDVSAYIPTNVISITDGQIFLDSNLFNKGIRPAIDVGISVSRVGSAAQTKAMKKVSGDVKLKLAQFRELEAFMQFASDLDEGTREKLESSRKVVEGMKQKNNSPLGFEKQTVALYFMTNKELIKNIEVENMVEVEAGILSAIENEKPEIFEEIKSSKKLEDETKEKLNIFITEYLENK
ncbi:MAG TPA: F0F1 ATP synthase subunit alpha [Candidatus Pacebacteria bacterium]|nr:F0F1 ATP synthase subunit alpha [Candidatus Paceibacterota bacterium]HIP33329.1 F0F1 ATP synthase subunit alpha [Bacteroidia bacterium]